MTVVRVTRNAIKRSTSGESPDFLFFYNYDSGTTHSENGVSVLTPTNAQGTVSIASNPSPRGSTTALRMNVGNGEVDWLPEIRWQIAPPGLTEFWLEFSIYWPDGTEGMGPAFDLIDVGNHHFKQLRWGDGETHNDDAQLRAGCSMQSDESIFVEYGTPGIWVNPGPPPPPGDGTCQYVESLGAWHRYLWHIKSPTVTPTEWGNGNGIIQLDINGVRRINITTASQCPANTATQNGYIGGAQTGCYVATGSKFDLTDIIIHTSEPSL